MKCVSFNYTKQLIFPPLLTFIAPVCCSRHHITNIIYFYFMLFTILHHSGALQLSICFITTQLVRMIFHSCNNYYCFCHYYVYCLWSLPLRPTTFTLKFLLDMPSSHKYYYYFFLVLFFSFHIQENTKIFF